MSDAPIAPRTWTRSPWLKWSWLLLLIVIVAQSLDYHWRKLPTTAAGYFARGRADYLLGEYESAIGNFTRSLELDPKDAESYIWRGEAYAKLADFTRAMPDLAKALALRPDYAKAHAGLADGLAAAWDTDGAIAEYGRAIALDADYGRCYLERGKALYDNGRYAEADADLRRAVSLLVSDNEVTAELFLWAARARMGDAAGATDELSRLVKRGDKKSNRFWNAAHFLSGEIAEPAFLAAAVQDRAGYREKDSAEAYLLAATKRLLSGDRAGALPLLRKVLTTDPEGSYAYDRARVELAGMLVGLQPRRVEEERRPHLSLAPDAGLVIARVTPGGAAEAAGLRPGAIVAAIDGAEAGQDAFVSFLEKATPGSTVTLLVIEEDGSRREVPLTLRLDSSAPTK